MILSVLFFHSFGSFTCELAFISAHDNNYATKIAANGYESEYLVCVCAPKKEARSYYEK